MAPSVPNCSVGRTYDKTPATPRFVLPALRSISLAHQSAMSARPNRVGQGQTEESIIINRSATTDKGDDSVHGVLEFRLSASPDSQFCLSELCISVGFDCLSRLGHDALVISEIVDRS